MAMSQGVQRIVAIALLVLVFAVIWRLALQPAWRHWQSGEEFIDQQLNTIARLRAISSSQAQYSATLAKVKSDSGVDAQLCVLGHLGALVPGQRTSKLLGQRDD